MVESNSSNGAEFNIKKITIPGLKQYLVNLREIFKTIHDPRDNRGKKYDLDYVLSLYLTCVLCNKSDCKGARVFIKDNLDIFSAFFPEINEVGIPSVDNFCDVLAGVSKKELEKAFETFLETYYDPNKDRLGIGLVRKIEWEKIPGRHKRGEARYRKIERTVQVKNHYATDGKAVRASKDKEKETPMPYIGGVYDPGSKQYIKQDYIYNGKEAGEATIIRQELGQMDLTGIIITGDALQTKKETMEMIHRQGGEFLLKVKRDSHSVQYPLILDCIETAQEQERINKELEKAAADWGESRQAAPKLISHYKTQESYNGKLRSYEMTVVAVETPIFADYSPYISHVAHLKTKTYKSIYDENGKVIEERLESEYECGFFLSCELTAQTAVNLNISHWGIESSHWLLDRHMDEDRSTGRTGNQVFNRAVFKRMAYNILSMFSELVETDLERMETKEEDEAEEKIKKTRELSIREKFSFLQTWSFIAIQLVLGYQEEDYLKIANVYFQRYLSCLDLYSRSKNKQPKLMFI